MSVTSGFFNSVNHDRLYDAEQISSMFDGIITDGIYQGIGDAFIVKPYSELNNTVTVGTGRAWFDHTWTKNDTELAITLDDPNVLYDRIDCVVIDVDRRQEVRKNSIKVVKGTVSEHGVTKPTLIEEELHNQYPLAYVTVKAGSAAPIQAQYIENVIGQTKTPLVAGVLEHMDITMFVQQMEDEFNVWFEGLKDVVSGDSITNLQQQINEIEENLLPVKNTLADIIKNGTSDIAISDTAVPNGGTFTHTRPSTGSMDVDYFGQEGYLEARPNDQALILPDGKIVRSGTLARGSKAYYIYSVSDDNAPVTQTPDVMFYVKLYDKNCSLTSFETNIVSHSITFNYTGVNSSWQPYFTEQNPFICNVQADAYPVQFDLVTIMYYLNGEEARYTNGERAGAIVYVDHVQINSDGLISFSSSTFENTLVSSGGMGGAYDSGVHLPSASAIFPAYSDDFTPYFLLQIYNYAQVIKISNGSVTGGAGFTSPAPFAFSSNNTSSANGGYIYSAFAGYGTRGYHSPGQSYAGFSIESPINKSFRFNISDLSYLDSNFSAPSNFVFPRSGESYSLSNLTLKKDSYDNRYKKTSSSEGLFVTPAFSMGLSLLKTASLVLIKDYEDIRVALLFGNNDYRELFYDETQRVGAYNILKTSSSSNISIALDKIARNGYRMKAISNDRYILHDTNTTEKATELGEHTVKRLSY